MKSLTSSISQYFDNVVLSLYPKCEWLFNFDYYKNVDSELGDYIGTRHSIEGDDQIWYVIQNKITKQYYFARVIAL